MKSVRLTMNQWSHLIPLSPPIPESRLNPRLLSSAAALASNGVVRRNVFLAFKDWFRCTNIELFDSIFKVLKDSNEDKERALSQMQLHLSEQLVLQVLSYGRRKYDVLSCLRFFDWAGRQAHFHHTRATFHSIFQILSRAKLTRLMLDFLHSYQHQRFLNPDHVFRSTLILGYTLAGHIPIALQLIGNMRFRGLDLDRFCYNVLLHVMIDHGFSDTADLILSRISAGKLNDKMTNSIVVKILCKKRLLSDAEAFLRHIGTGKENGYGLSMLVDSLCQFHHFDKAWSLIQEFRAASPSSMASAYRVWIKNLTRVGNVDDALKFLDAVQREEIFYPDASTFNVLLFALLKRNRVRDVFHLLMDMQENGVLPNQSTMSAAFCFLCKVGMADVAVDLNDSISEFRVSPNFMAYAYLISTLCEEGNTRDAWKLLDSLIKQGFQPYRNTLLNLARALCRERKLDIMREILLLSSQQNLLIADSIGESFIAELCRWRRVDDAYVLFSEISHVAGEGSYAALIRGLSQSNRGDIACRLLIEMQDQGYRPDRFLFSNVFSSLFRTANPEVQFLKLLEKQMHRQGDNVAVYNIFMEGAGCGGRPDLARQVRDTMIRNGVKPNLQTEKVMLTSYFKKGELSRVLKHVEGLRREGKLGGVLCNSVVTGLCEMDRGDLALSFMRKMEVEGVVFKAISYEAVIHKLCERKRFDHVLRFVYELEEDGRNITTFMGNTLITAAMGSRKLYDTWTRMGSSRRNQLSCLYDVIGVFSSVGGTCVTVEALEEMIEVCYPMNLYTYNMMVKWYSSMRDMDSAVKVFDRMVEKGHRPNKWSFQYVLEGFLRLGDAYMGLRWLQDMEKRGLHHNHFSDFRFLTQ